MRFSDKKHDKAKRSPRVPEVGTAFHALKENPLPGVPKTRKTNVR